MSNVWVFGYGSLIWNPGFEYTKSMVGQIKGYSRRFFQGSDVHRGRPDRLGRVVTLVEAKEETTWGKAYLVKDKEAALSYLGLRESSIGGYTTILTHFHPRDPKEQSVDILVYIALPNNPLFLGSSSIDKIAHDIAHSQGEAGHNVEYLAKLIAFMKIELPHVNDEHLLTLEQEVKLMIRHQKSVVQLFEDAIEVFLTSSISSNFKFNYQEESKECQANQSNKEDEEEFDFEFDEYAHSQLRCINKF